MLPIEPEKFKDQDALHDYYYDVLQASERFTFLMQLLENPPTFEIEIHEMFLDSPEYNESNYEAIVAFATKYNELRPEEYSRTYEFIELALTTTAFYLKDKEQINRSLAVLKRNPVAGIDTVVKKVLFQLSFNGYFAEAVDFSEAVWRPLSESDKLWGYPEYDFAYTIYLCKLEKQYELLQSGNVSEWNSFLEIIKELGFDNSEERMDPVFSILSMHDTDNLVIDNLPVVKEERLLILNIHFLIYMKKTYNVPFILSEWWFNLLHGKGLFNKRKEPGAEFFIPYKVLDKYITGRLDTLLVNKEIIKMEVISIGHPNRGMKVFLHKHLITWTMNHLNLIKKKRKNLEGMILVLMVAARNTKSVA